MACVNSRIKSGADMATVNFVHYDSQSVTVLKNVVAYVKQDEKTLMDDGQHLISGINCTPQMTFHEFVATRESHHKESPVWFYHYTQAFHPDENITPQQAHELAKEFAARAWPDSEVLITTHIDKPHIHSHFLVNAVCHQTGRMLRQEKGTLKRLRNLSDELCETHGFSVLKPTQKESDAMSAREYRSAAKGESWKMQIICAVDGCMKRSGDKDEFIRHMKKLGYQVRWEDARRSITYTHPNGMKARDIKLFDKRYQKEVMEREFRIRAEIISGGVEAAPSADNCADSGTGTGSTARNASHEEGVDGDDRVSRYSVVSHGPANESAEKGQRTAGTAPDPDADGRAAESGEASGTNEQTGWEAEREFFFSAQNQTSQTASATRQYSGIDLSADGGGSTASALVGLGHRLEQLQSAALVMPVQHHTDRKVLQKEREKKIALGHKADDHEDEVSYDWQQTM